MKKNMVIGRLCALTDRVATEVFKNQKAADCFCGKNLMDHAVTEEGVIDFIEKAVRDAIEKESTIK